MKKIQAYSVFTFVFCIVLLCFIGCKSQEEEKVPITTTSESAKENFIKARDLVDKLRTQESLEYVQNAVDADPNFAMAYLLRAPFRNTSHESLNDLKKAVSLKDNVSEGERLMILAFEAEVNGNTSKELEHLQKLVSLYPNDERALSLLGTYYYSQQDYQKAIDQLNKAIKIAPNFSAPYNMVGYANMSLKNYDEAEKAFKKYIELIPDEPNPYDSYAEFLLRRGNYDASIENYQKALNINPDFISSEMGIVSNNIYKGNYADARKDLQRMFDAAKTDNDKSNIIYYTAITYIEEGKMNSAIKEFEKDYLLGEKNRDAYWMGNALDRKGDVLFESGKYNDALDNYIKSINKFNESTLTSEMKENIKRGHLMNESRIALMQKDFETAVAKSDEFTKGVEALNNANQIKQANSLKGMIALEQEKVDDCIAALNGASIQDPYVLLMLGKAHHLKGNTDKAKEYYSSVINFNQLPTLNSTFARVMAKKMLKTI